LFLPGVISIALSKRKEGIGRGFLFLLVWFVSIFLFFSFSKGKREIYLLPLYPAASLMVGNLWDNYISNLNRNLKREVWVSVPVYILAAFFFFMGIILYLIPLVAGFPINPSTPKFLGAILKGARLGIKYLSYVPYRSFAAFIIFLLGSGILLALSQRLRHKLTVFLLIVVIVGIGFFYGTRFIFPLLDPYKSARFLSLEIQQIMKPGDKLAMYGGFAIGPYNFYTGIVPILDIESEQDLLNFFSSKERGFCLIQNHEYEALKKDLRIPLHLVTRRKVGNKDILLTSNQ
jgi:hypothetical protein